MPTERIVIAPGSAPEALAFLDGKGLRNVLVVADATTAGIVGERLADTGRGLGMDIRITRITPNPIGDVVADEASVVQVLLDMQRQGTNALIAAGAGTIHDIVRYAAFTTGVPFIGVPTAPSVDGFTSLGAPLLIRGVKTTVPAVGPIAIFADLDMIQAAPAPLIAAGFGDMIGKFTALLDWKVEHLADNGPYDEWIASVTKTAVDSCVNQIAEIRNRSAAGVKALMEALLRSGLAMLFLGSSLNASGAEHHLSHYWEMELLRNGRKQLLHGAKVGVATTLIMDLYKKIGRDGLPANRAGNRTEEEAIRRARIERNWPHIQAMIAELPETEQVKQWLAFVHGPSTIQELGVSERQAADALRQADLVRPNRLTFLHFYNR